MTKRVKKMVVLAVPPVIIFVGSFYWFQIRPSNIRKYCLNEVQKSFGKNPNTASNSVVIKINKRFRTCLAANGISPESLYEEPIYEPDPAVNELDTSPIENSIDDLKQSIQEENANREYEEQQRGRCEGGGGTYYGNGFCITPN